MSAVEKVREYVRACKPKYSTYADAVVIVTVHNSGNGWAKLEAGDSDYTIYDKSGGITTTGSFLYAYPKYLAPGETGYLADTASVDGGKTADFVKVEADGRYTDVDENDAIVLETSKVKLRKESFGGGRIATGLVTNTSTTDVDQAHVGAFYLDAAGRAVGFSETNLIENLNAGKSKGFETVTTDCPPNFANVEKTVVLAGDDNF